jgi:hypothetical protein
MDENTKDDRQRAAELWALNDDENLTYLLAWRLVRQRAESEGFNGLLASDFTHARAALDVMLEKGTERISRSAARNQERR